MQQVIQETLSTYFRTSINITGAGRTDTGVHARQLFFHVDIEADFEQEETRFKLNRFLPKDISIQQILPVISEAHARFDAIARTYEYWIALEKDPFLQDLTWHLQRTPDINLMNQAAEALLSHQDFECFNPGMLGSLILYHMLILVWQFSTSSPNTR